MGRVPVRLSCSHSPGGTGAPQIVTIMLAYTAGCHADDSSRACRDALGGGHFQLGYTRPLPSGFRWMDHCILLCRRWAGHGAPRYVAARSDAFRLPALLTIDFLRFGEAGAVRRGRKCKGCRSRGERLVARSSSRLDHRSRSAATALRGRTTVGVNAGLCSQCSSIAAFPRQCPLWPPRSFPACVPCFFA